MIRLLSGQCGVSVGCFDEFAASLTKSAVVIPDDAATHQSPLFHQRIAVWRELDLLIQTTLRAALEAILTSFGTTYRITFV